MTLDLALVFAALMGFSILAYVVLDGYDLGVGMLMPAANAEEQRLMVASIGPYWDANETWLVLGIGLLLVAFPLANGVVLTSLYLPVLAMLIGLMLRGVAFELRVKAQGWLRELWNWLFWFGSFLASLAQGYMLGSYITAFESGFGYWLFALMVAASLCGGYVMLGAAWLVWRTEGELQRKALGWTQWGLLWVALGIVLVSAATPLASATVRERWFDFPRTAALMLLPAATAAVWLWIWRMTARLKSGVRVVEWAPFAGAVAIYCFAFAGLAYSLFPYLVMDRITIHAAAAHPSSLRFLFAGVVIVLPMIIGYSLYVHRVFRGKVSATLYEH